ncbi:Cytochrome c-type biogenesis protein CcmF [Alphaproteobacteria bacterium SO-S41]|nr:Cytochrome c-type biogenesis protein CcmF [Alphaproteobacteria bacterium SO-S41]
MIPEIGHFALLLGLALALYQAAAGFFGAARRAPRLMESAGAAAIALAGALAVSFGALIAVYVQSDFSVAVVVGNSHSAKPLLYKIAGAWGNHEGSMLLWSLMLALFGAMVAVFGRGLPPTLKARVLGVQALIGVAFLLFIAFTSNPFARLDPAPLDGRGLNPLLQDPGLAFHPPLLYAGYVGFSITFAFAVAGLIEGKIDAAWARWVRPWALAAWMALTLGIALGSWWAYYELGWGGFWFWDPVENASLLPWLAGAALLHSAIVCERREAMKAWTVFLALLAFSFSLLGTFLVRSGVLTSVHAFASDPERGVFILAILVLTVGISFALFAWRAPSLRATVVFSPVSRETALALNNLLLTSAALAVLIGTLYPLVVDALSGEAISVGPPYFNLVVGALFLPLLIIVPFGPRLAWKRAQIAQAATQLWAAAGVALVIGIAVLALQTKGPWLAAVGIALGAWLICGALSDLAERSRLFRVSFGTSLSRLAGLPGAVWGSALAHAGVGVTVLGVVAATAWAEESIKAMKAGDIADIGPYHVTLVEMAPVQGANYIADRAVLKVERGGAAVLTMTPERRFFPVSRTTTTETAIHTTGFSDLYAALGERMEDGEAWTVRLHYRPLAPFIWLGALLMAAGGALSLLDRRLRVGAPSRRIVATPVAAE